MIRVSRLLALLVLLALCLSWLPAAAQDDSPAVPRFEPAPCWVGFPPQYETVECGYLVVPEEHANPGGPVIRLPLAIFPAQSARAYPDPVIHLAGGPGTRSLDGFVYGLGGILDTLNLRRDVIVFDQRGVGYAEPALDCPEVEALSFRVEQSYLADLPLQAEAAAACYARLAAEGVNIGAFNTIESAADVAAIAPALGYETYNLYGGSYGSMLGLTVMRHHPENLRSAVLQALSPPQVDLVGEFGPVFERAINRLFEACAADPVCGVTYPGLPEMFYTVIERFNAEPVPVTTTNPLTGQPVTMIVSGDDVVLGIQQAMYSPWGIRRVPLFIAALNFSQVAALEPLVQQVVMMNTLSTPGAHYAMRCMDDVLTAAPEDWDAQLDGLDPALRPAFAAQLDFYAAVCADWGVQPLALSINEATRSAIPTLLLDGLYDPVTAPEWAALAAETLPESYVYLFPDAGHGVDSGSDCAARLVRQFVFQPEEAPDAACLEDVEPLRFELPFSLP